MPYLLTEDGVIVEDLDGVSWTDVIKQQRARAAVEARYAELDAVELDLSPVEENVVVAGGSVTKAASELVRIEVGDQALTASLMERMDAMSQREALTTEALVAALHAIGTRESVVNVAPSPAPNVTVEAPPPAEVQVDVHVPEQAAPSVTVNPEIVLPQAEKKTVTFVRSALDGKLEGAEITEE